MRRLLYVAIALIVPFCAYLALKLPIGVPGQWVWMYAQQPAWLGAGQALPAFAAFAALLAYGVAHGGKFSRGSRLAWCLVTAAAFFAFCLSTLYLHQFDRYELYYLMHSPSVNGTYLEAAKSIDDTRAYLNRYEEKMARPVSGYRSTHLMSNPPGLALLLRALLRPLAHDPALAVRLGEALEPPGAWEMQKRTMGEQLRERWFARTAETMLGALGLYAIVALLFVPLYYLALELVGPASAAVVAGLAALAPNLHVFNPYKNSLESLFFVCLWLAAVSAARLKSRAWAFAAGACFSVGMLFTLMTAAGALLAGLALLLWLVTRLPRLSRQELLGREALALPAAAVAGALLPALALYLWSGYNPVLVLLQGVHGQHSFFAKNTRTYSLWVFVNVWEWLLLGGGAVAALAATAAVAQFRRVRAGGLAALDPYFAATLLTLAALDLLGMPLSETGRHWIFLTLALAVSSARACGLEAEFSRKHAYLLLLAAVAQAAVYLLLLDVWEASHRIASGQFFG